MHLLIRVILAGLFLVQASATFAWDYEAHRAVNQLALSALPTNFPGFALTPAAQERIAFLSGEPDRWRNAPDLALRHGNGPDHYLDLEELATYGLKPGQLTPFRYDFVAALALVRAAQSARFPAPSAARNEDHTRELIGLLPWALAEQYGKLKSAFAYLKALQADGTPEEIKNAQDNIIYLMGLMGHLAGDASQPLHTTIHHHGWVGPNPRGYTTNSAFHAWIDGGFIGQTGGLEPSKLRTGLRPAQTLKDSGKGVEVFDTIVACLAAQNQLVEPLYQLDKDGKLKADGPEHAQGRAFLEDQLRTGAALLADLWLSAWEHAPEDHYLKGKLAERKAATAPVPAK